MFSPVQGSKYLVTSFVQHVHGHFIAFVRCGGRWLKCDDSIVTDSVAPSSIWPTVIFLEKYRRRRILGPSALRPAAPDERLRSLPLQLSRVALEVTRVSEAGNEVSDRRCDVSTVIRLGLFASRERLRRKNLQRSRKRTLSADASLPPTKRRRAGRKQQRAGRKQQRAGRKQQRAGRAQQQAGRAQQ